MITTLLAALADPQRWRLIGLLAERPRPVGVLADLAEARQPQTTKHLQTLERTGMVTSQRSGQRRIYALRSEPLRDLARILNQLADAADDAGGPQQTYGLYAESLTTERQAAHAAGWADGRAFAFTRQLDSTPAEAWRHLTDSALLRRWWVPDDLQVSELVFEPRPGGRIVLEYRELEDNAGTDPVAGRAEGAIDDMRPGELLRYRLSPLLPDGGIAFTAEVTLRLRAAADSTELSAHWQISDSTVESADFIAGIRIGFGQSLDHLVAALATGPDHTNN